VPYDSAKTDVRDVTDINVTGTWNTVMAGAQKIIDGGRGGSIVLIGSAAGVSGDMIGALGRAMETYPQLA
jgi:NAD(P)-dependent dehydrogenase (short-subunit alcohol dehydrogenase family)